jgi:hypothetical protein
VFNCCGVKARIGRDERVIKPVLLVIDVAVGCR